MNYHPFNDVNQGWQCPVCRKVWNPNIPSCDCHKSVHITFPYVAPYDTSGTFTVGGRGILDVIPVSSTSSINIDNTGKVITSYGGTGTTTVATGTGTLGVNRGGDTAPEPVR